MAFQYDVGRAMIDDWYWTHPALPRFFDTSCIPLDTRSVLDVGCGKGTMGAMLRLYRHLKRIVGIDVCDEYLDFVRADGAYSDLIRLDLAKSKLPFADAEFDVVLCIDVLEHMELNEAMALVAEMERVGKHVVISTGGKPTPQDDFDDNPYQQHRCAPNHRLFRKRGYHIEGTGPFAFTLNGRMTTLPYISDMLSGVVRHTPAFAQGYIATRSKSAQRAASIRFSSANATHIQPQSDIAAREWG